VAFPDVKIRENQTAADRLKLLRSWLEFYFNPTTVLPVWRRHCDRGLG